MNNPLDQIIDAFLSNNGDYYLGNRFADYTLDYLLTFQPGHPAGVISSETGEVIPAWHWAKRVCDLVSAKRPRLWNALNRLYDLYWKSYFDYRQTSTARIILDWIMANAPWFVWNLQIPF